MAKKNNIIEINGKSYDAITGVVLSHASAAPTRKKAHRVATIPISVSQPAMPGVGRKAARHVTPRAPAVSKTLMRRAVKKPVPQLKHQLKAQGPVDLVAQRALDNLAASNPWQHLEAKRLSRSQHITQSQLISHFSPESLVRTDAARTPVAPQKLPDQLFKNTQPARPSTPSSKHPKTTAELLEHALQHATSHEQQPPKLPRKSRVKRHIGMGAGLALVIVLIAVVASQNLSNVRLQVASARAGFSASLPDYQPSGFSQGQLSYSPGIVAAHFNSTSGQGGYTITQKTTPWDSTTLRDNFVVPNNPGYQTVQTSGRTIYLYGQGSATLVHDGIWYIIQSDGALSDPQLIQLASSF